MSIFDHRTKRFAQVQSDWDPLMTFLLDQASGTAASSVSLDDLPMPAVPL